MYVVHVLHRLVYVRYKHLQTDSFITASDTNASHSIRVLMDR